MPKHFLLFLAMLFAIVAPAAHAASTTYQISFTASSSEGGASGTYELVFDPSLTYTNETSGIRVISSTGNSRTIPTGNVGFNFDPSSSNGSLVIGGMAEGKVSKVSGGSNDFTLQIGNFKAGGPTFSGYYTFTDSEWQPIRAVATGTIAEIAPTPEPSSLMLLGTGVLGVAGVLRRRLAV